MKKIFILLSFIALFTFMTPNTARADDDGCHAVVIYCPDGTGYICVVCDYSDIIAWGQINCGVTAH